MSGLTGLSPNNPLRYTGAAVALNTVVTRNRAPTGADYRQPETGKLYPFNTFWLVAKDPTTGVQGDLWYLSKIAANVGYWIKLSSGNNGPLLGFNVPLGVTPIVPDSAGFVTYTSTGGTINITGSSANPNNNNINFDLVGGPIGPDLHVAKWIVNPAGSSAGANQTTITAAMAAASSGDTIFVMPAIYTENFTWKAGVNITAFTCDAYQQNVKIIGTITCTDVGTRAMSGITLQTNNASIIALSGTVNTIVELINCTILSTNSTAITNTSSGSGTAVVLTNCSGDITTTGITYYTSSTAGSLFIRGSYFGNSGNSTTPISAAGTGNILIQNSFLQSPITTSGTVGIAMQNSVDFLGTNAIALTCGGVSSGNDITNCYFASGSASSISISSGVVCFVHQTTLNSTNTNAITGAGTLDYTALTYNNTGHGNNVANKVPQFIEGGYYQGLITGLAVATGAIGEVIQSVVALGSAVPLTNNIIATVTSISLPAGIWDISCLTNFNGAVTGTAYNTSITINPVGQGVVGDTQANTPLSPTVTSDNSLVIPPKEFIFATTTTVYMNVASLFSAGTLLAYGRLSATRIG